MRNSAYSSPTAASPSSSTATASTDPLRPQQQQQQPPYVTLQVQNSSPSLSSSTSVAGGGGGGGGGGGVPGVAEGIAGQWRHSSTLLQSSHSSTTALPLQGPRIFASSASTSSTNTYTSPGGTSRRKASFPGGKRSHSLFPLSQLSMPLFLQRIWRFRQMDFEMAIWQMLWLCIAPRRVYVHIGGCLVSRSIDTETFTITNVSSDRILSSYILILDRNQKPVGTR